VPDNIECVVDEGAELAGGGGEGSSPPPPRHNPTKQDGDVVLVGMMTIQVCVEGGDRAGMPLEMQLRRS
jgi:hypothetical protein